NRKFVGMLLHILSGVEDFRQPMRVRHSLENIPCICLLLAMRGKLTSFPSAAMFIKFRADYFRGLGLIEGDAIPSHDTLRSVFMCLDASSLRDTVLGRIQEMIAKITGRTKGGKGSTSAMGIYDASSCVCLAPIPPGWQDG
ncbi:MAG: transposase family protein, partial [Succinivibrionaceae bacterium]|nr:transposase family protein [Succinivibrionaceae bacterium]